jgi:uncharacterized membrane protein (DUF4010 family)
MTYIDEEVAALQVQLQAVIAERDRLHQVLRDISESTQHDASKLIHYARINLGST